MSYIKKLEEDYNNGKISLKKIDEQREFYYKLSENERKEIDKKYKRNDNTYFSGFYFSGINLFYNQSKSE